MMNGSGVTHEVRTPARPEVDQTWETRVILGQEINDGAIGGDMRPNGGIKTNDDAIVGPASERSGKLTES